VFRVESRQTWAHFIYLLNATIRLYDLLFRFLFLKVILFLFLNNIVVREANAVQFLDNGKSFGFILF
jgi:hypothetical protein